jgi:hypothetical protein
VSLSREQSPLIVQPPCDRRRNQTRCHRRRLTRTPRVKELSPKQVLSGET